MHGSVKLAGCSWAGASGGASAGSRRSGHAARATRVYADMEEWSEIRRRVLVEGLSKRASADRSSEKHRCNTLGPLH